MFGENFATLFHRITVLNLTFEVLASDWSPLSRTFRLAAVFHLPRTCLAMDQGYTNHPFSPSLDAYLAEAEDG